MATMPITLFWYGRDRLSHLEIADDSILEYSGLQTMQKSIISLHR